MDIFDMIFGTGPDKNQMPNHGDEPVEQFVKTSVNHLFNTLPNISTKELEAEGIYLAAFLYLKDSYQIDFKLDYIDQSLIDSIPSNDYSVSDKVFKYMKVYGRGYYGEEEANYGIGGYKMNIQLCQDYGSYIKNYFIRAHKIGEGKHYDHFSSPRNSLWKNGEQMADSPTQRDVYYKIEGNRFELMVPPYNPLVSGKVIYSSAEEIKCQSSDGKRTFVFHFINNRLETIDMYRNDKGDLVKYHRV